MSFRNDFLEKLFHRKGGIKLGLGRIASAFPLIMEKKIPVYHVAGTNGKGTSVYAVSHILNSNGFITGRFISPHLYDYNERISVDGVDITDPEIVDIYRYIESRVPDFEELSFFEITLLIAWRHFVMKGCDRAVMEVGLGGRLDATNVIDWAKTDIITSIGFDHMHILGDTLEKIAFEKLGIIKKGDIVILGDNHDPEFDGWLEKEAYSRGADKVLNNICHEVHPDRIGLSMDQKKNIALACCAVKMTEKDVIIPDFSKMELPGRFEEIFPGVIIDVAHNAPAIASIVRHIKEKGMKVAVLYGAMKDKDITAVTELLAGIADDIFIVSLDAESRGAQVKDIVERSAETAVSRFRYYESDGITMTSAVKYAREKGLKLLVTGSFHTIEKFVRSGAGVN